MTPDKSQHGPCPLQWGDRVDHKMFGFGTIVGEPVATVGGSTSPPYVVPRGWSVPIKWDDPGRSPSSIGFDPERSNVLQKISSPDAKGHAYWENEWRKRLEPLLAARANTDAYLKAAFRRLPPFSTQELSALTAVERQALSDLETFLSADERGDHP